MTYNSGPDCDAGAERAQDVKRAEAVVASFAAVCHHDDVTSIFECDECMTRLIANAITDRRTAGAIR